MVLGFGPNGPNFTEICPIRPGPRYNKTSQNISAQFKIPVHFRVQQQPTNIPHAAKLPHRPCLPGQQRFLASRRRRQHSLLLAACAGTLQPRGCFLTSELAPRTLLDATHMPWLLLDAHRHAVSASKASFVPSAPPARLLPQSRRCCPPCVSHAGAACILCKPTAMLDGLEKFCSNLLKFHSNFEWVPVRIFRISSNSVGSELF